MKEKVIELKKLTTEMLKIFNLSDTIDLSNALFKCAMSGDKTKMNEFCDLVENDLSKDWLQMIFQYYEADRKEKKQDYTPNSIAKLCAELTETGGKTVYDICAGSGSLTIQKWVKNPDKLFICEELDENVIPYLLFNMAVRNMNGYVVNRDVLTMNCKKVYKLQSGDKFSTVSEIENPPEIYADEIISNPPFNISWNAPKPLFADERFKSVIPPASNANFAFAMTALSRMNKSGKAAFVFPCGVLTSKIEIECRKYLVDNGLIESVIELPNNMFECTGVATCIFVFSSNNKQVNMFNCRNKATQEKRMQNGQYGSASHTNRTYEKIFNVLPDELITSLCGGCEDVEEFSIVVSNEQIKENKYTLAPCRYIKIDLTEKPHRNLQEIVDNINYITRMQNSCKLVINETIAKSLGLDIEQFKESKQHSAEMAKQMKALGLDFVLEDYITFTKAKNEFVLKCNDKDIFPDILRQFFAVWKNQIALLNTMQNQYLTELRDAVLPDLMSGKLDLSNSTWIEDRTEIVCPHCGARFNDEIRDMMKNGEDIKYCPACGRSVKHDL